MTSVADVTKPLWSAAAAYRPWAVMTAEALVVSNASLFLTEV